MNAIAMPRQKQNQNPFKIVLVSIALIVAFLVIAFLMEQSMAQTAEMPTFNPQGGTLKAGEEGKEAFISWQVNASGVCQISIWFTDVTAGLPLQRKGPCDPKTLLDELLKLDTSDMWGPPWMQAALKKLIRLVSTYQK